MLSAIGIQELMNMPTKKDLTLPKDAPLFERVDAVPFTTRGDKGSIYDDTLDAILKQDAGVFKICIPKVKPMTVYLSLGKRIDAKHFEEGKKPTLHMRKDTVYLKIP